MRQFLSLLALVLIVQWLGSCHTYRSEGGIDMMYAPSPLEESRGEQYNEIVENPFVRTEEEPTSTFSVDADGGAFSNVRRIIREGSLPPKDAIRTEEFINYFPYNYADPTDGETIALHGEIATCPWTAGHQLIRIGMKGKSFDQVPVSNFVLLMDVSGSMSEEIELMKEALNLLVDQFGDQDRIAIVTYAGASEVVLNSTSGRDKDRIRRAIRRLRAGGSTAGAEGIITAYDIAQSNFIEGGNNRVLLATDGDFNVGPSSQEDLIALIEEKRETGVFLTTIGLGSGNYQEGQMEQLANHGNGTYEYIDNLEQAQKVLVHEVSKLYTVAKDVKVQVTFNPGRVESYRLIGYENRVLSNEDFTNDSTDAGEIGAGQTITALYEIVPNLNPATKDEPSFTIDFRYKQPDEDVSRPLTLSVADEVVEFSSSSEDMRFASAVAALALVMRESQYQGRADFDLITSWMNGAKSYDPHGYRQGAIDLVGEIRALWE